MIAQIKQLQKRWQLSLPRYSGREWCEIFGNEGRITIKRKIAELEKEAKELSLWIYESFRKIYQTANQNSVWFYELLIKVFWGLDLDILNKKIERLKWSLKKKNKTTEISDEVITKARNYPVENLVEANKHHFSTCPFHEDRHPSLYSKNGYFHCFQCGFSGDGIAFVMKRDRLSFKEAVKFLT